MDSGVCCSMAAVPGDVVHLGLERFEGIEANREQEGMDWCAATEGEELADVAGDVGLQCSRVEVVVGDGEEDPAAGGGDDAA